MTKFLEKKTVEKKFLTVQKLPALDIPPDAKKNLTISQPTIVSILPVSRCHSSTKQVLIDIPPGYPFYYTTHESNLSL